MGRSQVGMSADQIVAGVDEQPSIAMPITVELEDEGGSIVATLDVEWFVARRTAPQA
jgi:hypothetical protein